MAGLLQQPTQDPIQAQAPEPGQEPQDAMPPDMDGEIEADESNPAFQAAMKLAYDSLYARGAADNVANAIQKSPDIIEALANTAYEMVAVVDERTEGAVPDELLVLLASNILEEVIDIATTAGIEVTPSSAVQAMKTMILRYAGEQGFDTRELQAAMDQVSPDDFAAMMSEGQEQPQEQQMV